MTTLRQQFIRELVIRGTSPRTQESYIGVVYGLAKHYHQPPDQITDEQLKDYMFYLAQERKLAPASLNVAICALRPAIRRDVTRRARVRGWRMRPFVTYSLAARRCLLPWTGRHHDLVVRSCPDDGCGNIGRAVAA